MSEMQLTQYTYVPQFTLGDRLKRARTACGWTQAELAHAIGIHQRSVSNYESDVTIPNLLTLRAWASVTQVDLRWLAYGRPDAPWPTGGNWATGHRRATGAVTIRYPLMSRLGRVADNAAIAAA